MSVCTFLAADWPMEEVAPGTDYPVFVNVDDGAVYDGGADDNFTLTEFREVSDYTDKQYAVCLEWRYTEGRAKQIIGYIRDVLRNTDCVELWHVWLLGWYEYEDRPVIHRQTLSVGELTPEHIKDLVESAIWNTPDKRNPERPSFYCLTITR